MQNRFTETINKVIKNEDIVVQPRMGFGTIQAMTNGLQSVKAAQANCIGTLTIDSYTRVNNYEAARSALEDNHDLNGFPIVTHGSGAVKSMLANILSENFPVQVRHGTALPYEIFQVMVASGIEATEGGPVSYCLPYSRLPLEKAVAAWRESCRFLAKQTEHGMMCHLESFAGCMMGQLCPPSLLIALNILEGLFFKSCGLQSISLSYTQGTSVEQDKAAVFALQKLAEEYFNNIHWHVVVYTYMGVFPETTQGTYNLIAESAKLTKITGCARLIVKTPVEANRIPTIEENVQALEFAYASAQGVNTVDVDYGVEESMRIYHQASSLVGAVLSLDKDIGKALLLAFNKGFLDIPFCLHPDNANKSRTIIDNRGYLLWSELGNMPIPESDISNNYAVADLRADQLLNMLYYIRKRYDSTEQML